MSFMALPTTAPARPAAVSPDLRAWLQAELSRLVGQDRHGWLVLPAPTLSVEVLPELSDLGHGVVWDPPQGVSMSGVGVAWKIQLRGEDRFRRLRQAADPVLQATVVSTYGAAAPLEPRVLGGFSFDVGSADDPLWRDFGDGCFTLPRFVYGVVDGRAGLALVVHGQETAGDEAAWIDRTVELLHRLEARAEEPADMPSPLQAVDGLDAEQVSDPDWIRRIEDIRQAIAQGEVEKIVAARRCGVDLPSNLPSNLSATQVLALLGHGLKASTRFAFSRPSGTFLGATPERLLAKEGRRIHTEALAGSIERGHGDDLLDSGKDRLEQQLVVDSIVRRLEPLCDRLQVAARPTIRELRDVLHLHTPILGTLSAECHILDLVETLHPTPAVGGVPTQAALDWIRERETHARGWYAAPIGWFDARGDGELAVALRSCVLTPSQAYLFVGAGIVADSDPAAELRETELKKQALLSALQG